ncbi:hypothetical protein AVEN_232875-1 [Araneus ventricosus]|uniref:Uncharacterized protein n=1 Tax=Araneus ventricosus TaxID=182803 RepID=A0A4Y2MZY6_ARAVE|nr:hypothetical protein AVEN_232875-1 [Araneus ventricosus]
MGCQLPMVPLGGFDLQLRLRYNYKNKKNISYPNRPSALHPVPHDLQIPVPVIPKSIEDMSLDSDSDSVDVNFQCDIDNNAPQLFTKMELIDLERDLGLSKVSAEMLGSRLKRKKSDSCWNMYCFVQKPGTRIHFHTFSYFLVYCIDIIVLMLKIGVKYHNDEWRLFIDTSKRSLKAVLLHNGNNYASVLVGHSIHLKECYENIEFVLTRLKYIDHN